MSDKPHKILVDYIEESEFFVRVLSVALLLSENQGGIKTNGRGVRAMKIYTRQTLTAMSLLTILPKATFSNPDGHLWDIGSIATLTRNLIEGYLSLYYFGIENISESEADLRFQLLQLHRNVEWYNIRLNKMNKAELEQFEEGIKTQKVKIKDHEYLSNLSKPQKEKVLKWNEMYKTKKDFEEELDLCKGLIEMYRFLSNFAHALPISIERTNNEKGRGLGSMADINICLICTMHARKFLAATVTGIADHFHKDLGKKFHEQVESIRPLISKGFDN